MSTVLFAPSDDPKPGSFFKSNSLSGGERHRLFMRRDGNYKEFTLVSGADFREDGRGFVLFDYDGDGYLDMGITSPNKPRFRILRDDIPDQLPKSNNYLEVALVGGQTGPEPSTEWSPRDGYGATMLVTTGETKRMFHLSLGEGLSGQNAKRIHVGLGEQESVDSLEIRWPSGRTSKMENVAANQRVTVYENPDAKPE